ncbi:hypothetical protein SSX86_006167 [Deinandra increscens subsp. villosa]|uniref:Uncharacterized protein n=1 Tax=Deinandra increscens subsp. villosa TaxID=3103831 RepID=A0AAP0DRU8_9ASTR
MVGLFSRFGASRNGHLRSQSALDQREVISPDTVATEATSVAGVMSTSHHGIEVAVEFKPVGNPSEPLDIDQPIQCPLPEPSILNDGRIWKERVSAGVQKGADLEETAGSPEPDRPRTNSRPRTNRMILPSISAPEHNILKLLEEAGIEEESKRFMSKLSLQTVDFDHPKCDSFVRDSVCLWFVVSGQFVSLTLFRLLNPVKDQRAVISPDTVAAEATSVAGVICTSHHGIEIADEFTPVGYPSEPLDIDQPIQCPLPEPSILNDGRIWKERVSAGVQRGAEPEETAGSSESDRPRTNSRPRTKRMILPSISAPEHNIFKLLEDAGM